MHEEIASYIEAMASSPAQLTDVELLAEVKRLARCEREITATLVAHLVEVEARDLHCAEGCSTMFQYCTEVLRLSEAATYRRLQAARLAAQNPQILADLASGALNLSAVKLLAPILSPANQEELLAASRHKSKREVEKLIRKQYPLPDVPATVRKLPARSVKATAPTGLLDAARGVETPVLADPPVVTRAQDSVREVERHPSVIAPLAPARYKVQFTASEALHDKLRRAQDLLRHRIPDGDVAEVMELALALLVEKLEKQKLAATDRPRARAEAKNSHTNHKTSTGSRTIPADVKRAVWKRDGGRCAYIAIHGRRCLETGFLEFHHVVAFARGGDATVENIALRCRSHNQYEARLEFGPWKVGSDDRDEVREHASAWGATSRESVVLWVTGPESAAR